MGKLIIVEEEKQEDKFTTSSCTCPTCVGTHIAVIEWNLFIPRNKLQRNMKRVVARIEEDIRTGSTRLKRKRLEPEPTVE